MTYIFQRQDRASISNPATFLHETWLPPKRRQLRATTAYRNARFVEHYISRGSQRRRIARCRAETGKLTLVGR